MIRAVALGLLLTVAALGQAADEVPPLEHFDPAMVDTSVSPCTDFYAYSCNTWLARHPIPPDRGSFGRGSSLFERNRYLLKATLEHAAAERGSGNRHAQIGAYYAACMDEPAAAARGLATLKAALAEIDALTSVHALPGLLARVHQRTATLLPDTDSGSHTALFGFGAGPDLDDASVVVLGIDQGGMSLPDREYYLRTDDKSVEMRKAYRSHVARMFELAGDAPDRAAAESEVVLTIETALARSALEIVKRRDPANLNHKLSFAELTALTPDFSWGDYLAALHAPAPRHYLVLAPDFMKGMNEQIRTRSVDDWKTYLRWSTLHASAPYLSAPLVEEDFQMFGQRIGGAKRLPARWKRCVSSTDRDLGDALGQAFVDEHFRPEAKARMLKLVASLEAALATDIRGLDWMTGRTREQALEKLQGIVGKIGYPDHPRDYTPIAIAPDDALGNAFRSSAFELRRRLAKVGKPPDRTEWGMTAVTVDAQYDAQLNTINFPAGILQPPIFDDTMDDAVNFGVIGAIIGHELTHGFDDEGRKFDASGNLRDWWTEEDSKNFEQRAACVADQYSKYPALPDVMLNGRLTLGENIADAGGLRVAYMALMETLAAEGAHGETRDGLTPAQRFFLSYGEALCRNQSPENLRLMAQADPHSPPRYRVNGVVSNMPEFRAAFGCRAGDPMVRDPACRVW